jgi:hypothetical protein
MDEESEGFPMTLNPLRTEVPAIPAQDLDAVFGELLTPDRVDPLESNIRPLSLQRLDRDTGEWLKAFMKATEAGLGVTRFVYCEIPILWVADNLGDIWFAVEEIITADTQEFIRPRFRKGDAITSNYCRLGHPALLGAQPGRIGGEILFDARAEIPAWFITNGSGRYGLRQGRLPIHLAAAKQKFQEHGISLTEYFLKRRA